jgi:phage terminase Nu1 subunit (DNA packaging protein)
MADKNGFYSKKTIADLFGITERRVEQLAQKKLIPKAGKGLFDLGPTVKAYITYLHGLVNGAISGDESELSQRLLQAQTLEREAKAAISQIELERKKGKIITLEEVKRQWSARLIEFKAAMLEMPKQAAFRFTDPDVRIHVEEELNSFVIEALARYSRGGICAVGEGDNAADPPSPEGDDCERMGGREPDSEPEGESASGAVENEQNAVSS